MSSPPTGRIQDLLPEPQAEVAIDHFALVVQADAAHLFLAFRAEERIGFRDLFDQFAPLGRRDAAGLAFGRIDDPRGPFLG
jgi:hypothetical protein